MTDLFAGSWGWFSLAVALFLFLFTTVLGEGLLFRGFLLAIRPTSYTISVPSPTTTAASEWVRRQSKVPVITTLTASASPSALRSSTSTTSRAGPARTVASRIQSRQTRSGACAGRGSSRNARSP